jgi:hypothetical protein
VTRVCGKVAEVSSDLATPPIGRLAFPAKGAQARVPVLLRQRDTLRFVRLGLCILGDGDATEQQGSLRHAWLER